MSKYYCLECDTLKNRDYDGYNPMGAQVGVCDGCAQDLESKYISEITERYMASVGFMEALEIVRYDMEKRLGRQGLEWLKKQHNLIGDDV